VKEETYWNAAHSCVFAVWNHLSLFLSVEQVVVILHRNELVPTMLACNILQCLELPSRHLHHAHQLASFNAKENF
jgi:hypothetical protein